MIIDRKQLEPYLFQESDIIPIHTWNKQIVKNGKTILKGKTPLYSEWTKSPKDIERTLIKAEQGYNVGYRLSDIDLIIDVDPRNFGDVNSLDLLHSYLGIEDLSEIYPTVLTGGGGYHYYMTKPADILLKETNEMFPGIEFKTKGRQVLCAGSKHPNGKYYEWDDFGADFDLGRDKAPTKLLELLKKEVSKSTTESGAIDNLQLSKLLHQLPVDKFDDNDSWFVIMCASHHGTSGKGIEEFLEWSLGDKNYDQDEYTIRARWESLSDKEISYTVNSLYKQVLNYGGTIDAKTATEDFEEFKTEVDPETEESERIDSVFEKFKNTGKYNSAYNPESSEAAKSLINDLCPASNSEDLSKAIRSAIYVKDDLQRMLLMDSIQAKTKIKQSTLNKVIKAIEEQVADSINADICRMLAEVTNESAFHKGKGLIYTVSEQFWAYNGCFWEVITKKYLESKVTKTLDKLRDKTDITKSENSLVMESSAILGRMCAVNKDALGLTNRPKPVINFLNGELWLNRAGVGKLRPHKPESHLLQMLNANYDPNEQCPMFHSLLRSTFRNFDDTEDLVEFVFEMIGYIIQPNKDLERWFLFYGKGGDGKSTIIRIISALLGNSVLPESINMFATDNHVLSDVPGKLLIVDDDMDKKTTLPDGILKKLCGRNDLNANPKGSKTVQFTPACTVILSCNGLPITNDLSEGGRRRPIVLPFRNMFHLEGNGGIVDIAEKIIKKELSGIINESIKGLQRLRVRERFKEPYSCRLAKSNWISESNMNALFVEENLIITNDQRDRIFLNDLFAAYNDWCFESGIKHLSGKQFFRRALEDLGLKYNEKMHGNKRGFSGIKFKENENKENDFEDF